MLRSKKRLIIILLFVICIALWLVLRSRANVDDSTVSIVIAPNYEHAILALGGMIAHNNDNSEIIATFFAGPETTLVAHKKNPNIINFDYIGSKDRGTTTQTMREDLERSIAVDIQTLIIAHTDKDVKIYAPSVFGTSTTDADQEIIHNAFRDVAENYPKKNVSFYFYEDYPNIDQFNKSSVISLEKNLENETGKIYDQEKIELTNGDLRTKEKSLESLSSSLTQSAIDFTKKRCGETACEVVYKLFKI